MTDLDKRKVEVEELREKVSLINSLANLLSIIEVNSNESENLRKLVVKKIEGVLKAIPFY